MAAHGQWLCHLCGSTDFEEIDDAHIRCTECGHGASFTRLTAVTSSHPSPEMLAQIEQQAHERGAQTEAAFRDASFRPYALDAEWQGLRWFGGHGGSSRPGERATSLTLAFSDDPRDPDLPELRIETRRRRVGGIDDPTLAAAVHASTLAQTQVEHLWRQTGVLREDVRRHTFPGRGAMTDAPTSVWERRELTVDGDQVEFAFLREGTHWVAQAIVDGAVVGIQARGWPLESTGLTAVDDFDPYVRGSHEVRRRWSQPERGTSA